MGTCRIADLIPSVMLKKINIYESTKEASPDKNTGFLDPHVNRAVMGQSINIAPDDSKITYTVHICAHDIVVEPNVDISMTERTIIEDDVAQVVDTVEQGYSPPLPQDEMEPMTENALSFSQYFMNKQFTDMFRIWAYYVHDSSVVRWLETINNAYPFSENRAMAWKIMYLLELANNQSILLNTNDLMAVWADINLGLSDLGLPTLPLNAGEFMDKQEISFKSFGTLEEMLSEGSAEYDIDGNLVYSILPQETDGNSDDLPFLHFEDPNVNRQDAAFLFFPFIHNSPSVWTGNHPSANPTGLDLGVFDVLTNTDAELYEIFQAFITTEGYYSAMAEMFHGSLVFQRVLQNNKSIAKRFTEYGPYSGSGMSGPLAAAMTTAYTAGPLSGANISWQSNLIQDFRVIERLKNINLDNYRPIWEAVMANVVDRELDRAAQWWDSNFISDLFSSFTMPSCLDGSTEIEPATVNYFTFNLFECLRQKSMFPEVYNNLDRLMRPAHYGISGSPDNDAYDIWGETGKESFIKQIRIYRKRLSKKNAQDTKLIFDGKKEFKRNQNERLLCYTGPSTSNSSTLETRRFYVKPTLSTFPDILVSSISEISPVRLGLTQKAELTINDKIGTIQPQTQGGTYKMKHVCFVDTEVSKKTTGTYSYRVEIDIKDHILDKIVNLTHNVERALHAYDNIINYATYNNKQVFQTTNTGLPLYASTSGVVDKQVSTNYHWLTNTISNSILQSPEYENLIDLIKSPYGSFKKLFIMFTGAKWDEVAVGNNMFHIPGDPATWEATTYFNDLLMMQARRDMIYTFYSRILGMIGYSGVSRIRPMNLGFKGSTYNHGKFSLGNSHEYNIPIQFKYQFKQTVDVDKIDNLAYDIIGTRKPGSAAYADSTFDRLAFNNNLGPTSVHHLDLQERLDQEWRKLTNIYTSITPPPIDQGARFFKHLSVAGVVNRKPPPGPPVAIVEHAQRLDVHRANKVNYLTTTTDAGFQKIRQLAEMEISDATNLRNIYSEWPNSANPGSPADVPTTLPESRLFTHAWFGEYLAQSNAGTVDCSDPFRSVTENKIIDQGVVDKKVCEVTKPYFTNSWTSETTTSTDIIAELAENFEISRTSPEINENSFGGPCDNVANYLISRIVTYLEGYNYFDRKDHTQGVRLSQKFDLTTFENRITALKAELVAQGLSTGQVIPFEAFGADYSVVTTGETSLDFAWNLLNRLDGFKIYRLEYLAGWDLNSMKPYWLSFNYDQVETFLLAYQPYYFCRLKQVVDNSLTIYNNAMDREVYDKYFILTHSDKAGSLRNVNFTKYYIAAEDLDDPHRGPTI